MLIRVKKHGKTVGRPSKVEKQVEKMVNWFVQQPEFRTEFDKRFENLMLYGTTHPEVFLMNRVINIPMTDGYYEDTKLSDERFIEEIKGFDWLAYTYGTGSYEGSGSAIWKKDGKYHQASLGHCSCYGPLDNLHDKNPKDSLEEILKDCSEGLKNELKPMIEELEKQELVCK